MKTFHSSIFFAAAVSAVLLISSCGNANKQPKEQAEHLADAHEHTYTCPMHPEVTGKEGDTCPKCGMKLIHNDNAASNGHTYRMQVLTEPGVITAGASATLLLKPVQQGDEQSEVPLDVEHDKKIHLIVVSEDLSYFMHLHPEYTAQGNYTVSTVFPDAGNYIAYSDYRPTGAVHQLEKTGLTVQGKPAKKAAVYHTEQLSARSDGYEIELLADRPVESHAAVSFSALIRKNGQEIPADKLENYLGAKAHVVMIGVTEKDYLHVHPEVKQRRLHLQTSFGNAGIYRAWLQFQDNGAVHTADFVIAVKQGNEQKAASTHQH